MVRVRLLTVLGSEYRCVIWFCSTDPETDLFTLINFAHMCPTAGLFPRQVLFLIILAVSMSAILIFVKTTTMVRLLVVGIRVIGWISPLIFVVAILMPWVHVSTILVIIVVLISFILMEMSRLFILAKLLCLKVEDIVRYEFLHVMR